MCVTVQIDENSLKEAGYVRADKFSHVKVSRNIAAKILGKSVNTIISSVTNGLIPADDDDKILLSDALMLDPKELHDLYIKSRKPVFRRKNHNKL
ncbi:MAG: hypothetical protein RR137_10915 [Odoribacter sp.]